MSARNCTVGLDFGTASARALALDTETGEEVASSVYEYRHGEGGVLTDRSDPNLARQEPRDYVAGLELTLAEIARSVAAEGGRIVALGSATTGSTPLPVNAAGVPVALDPKWASEPAAKAWLWKDHTSYEEAREITRVFESRQLACLEYVGGTYSSEWFWAKILRCARTAPGLFAATHTWMELSDFIPSLATGTGVNVRRNACAAGHKALFAERWGGLPPADALGQLDPRLADLRDRLYNKVWPATALAGLLDPQLAVRLGLPADVAIAVGTFDAHAGAIAGGVRPGRLVKIIGTSTCDCTVTASLEPIPGVCGVVSDSVVPGLVGIEAGQSAVGDLFDWFLRLSRQTHADLSAQADAIRPGATGLLGLDWNNGNRTVLVDPLLGGLLVGQSLATTTADIYRALIEATAFGARVIIERIEENNVPITDVVVSGSVGTNSLAMQIYADVLNRPVRVAKASNASAAGAAIYAAVAGGTYATVEDAQAAMGGTRGAASMPRPESGQIYARLYALYRQLHDSFAASGPLGYVMKELIQIRNEVRG